MKPPRLFFSARMSRGIGPKSLQTSLPDELPPRRSGPATSPIGPCRLSAPSGWLWRATINAPLTFAQALCAASGLPTVTSCPEWVTFCATRSAFAPRRARIASSRYTRCFRKHGRPLTLKGNGVRFLAQEFVMTSVTRNQTRGILSEPSRTDFGQSFVRRLCSVLPGSRDCSDSPRAPSLNCTRHCRVGGSKQEHWTRSGSPA